MEAEYTRTHFIFKVFKMDMLMFCVHALFVHFGDFRSSADTNESVTPFTQ